MNKSSTAINIDTVTKSEWDSFPRKKPRKPCKDFTEYLEANQRRDKSTEHFLQSALQPPKHYF